MRFRDPVSEQLRDMAWSIASRPPAPLPTDPRDPLARIDERRAGCLALLRALARMSNAIQRRIDITSDEAMRLGASYGQIAEACGVSRQAARQRSLRRHPQRQGEPHAAQGQAPVADPGAVRPMPGPTADSAPPPGRPAAVAAKPGIQAGTNAPGGKVRVYELAKEFGVEPKVVMVRINEMGEFVRSAASTIDPPVVRRLRELFAESG